MMDFAKPGFAISYTTPNGQPAATHSPTTQTATIHPISSEIDHMSRQKHYKSITKKTQT